ncbi:MAG: hypothetical protein MUE60_05955 [Candidatus Eisenbacteria bacterium]|jgi:hypothetical protein|nr:hypothetical protein [Candidatus Eisenbacteria bacterium]
MSRRCLFLVLVVVLLCSPSWATLPDDIHLIQPYPRGKADSVLAARERLVFIPGPELSALEEAVKAGTHAPPAPPVPGTVSSATLEGSVSGDIARLSATYIVDVFEAGAVYVPLVARSLPILSVRQAGIPLRLTAGGAFPTQYDSRQEPAGAWWGVVVQGSGRRLISASLPVPVDQTDDGGSLQVSLPTVGASVMTLRLPPGEWDVESAGPALRQGPRGESVEVRPGVGGTMSVAWRQATRRVARPRETREVTLEATGEHLASVGEAAVKGQVQFNLRVWTGQVQMLDIVKPEGVEVMNVSGPSVDTWEQSEGSIRVYLASPVQGEERLTVEYLLTMSGPEGAITLPPLAVSGARRQLMHWAVVATTNIEVELAESQSVEVLQPRELPEGLKGVAAGRILVALRGDPTQAVAVLRVSRHADVPVLVASIDQATFTTVVYQSGQQVTTCRYDMRNTTKQFLELALPQDAQLWDVRVDRQPVRPGLVESTVLVPLASSLGRSEETSFPVEITYLVPMRLSPFAGRLVVQGPRPDLPASRVTWDLRYPGRLCPIRWGGNMEREPSTGSRRMGLPLSELMVPSASEPKMEHDMAGRDDDVSQRAGEAWSRNEERKSGVDENQRMRQMARDYLQKGASAKATRRSIGKPSVEVSAPAVGKGVRFSQILQQAEAPVVRCIYVRGGVRWDYVGLVAVVLLGAMLAMRWRRRHVIAALVLIALDATAAPTPREVLRMVPNDELARLLTGPTSQEYAFIPYSRISALFTAIRTGQPVSLPAAVFLDKVELALSVEDDEARITGTATMMTAGSGWRAIDLVGDAARVSRVTLAGNPAALWSSDAGTRVLTDAEGMQPLEFEYATGVTIQGNSRSVACPVPRSPGCLMTITLPLGSSGLTVAGRRVDLETDAKAATVVVAIPGQVSVPLSWRYVPPELVLPAGARPGEAGPTRGRLMAEALTLYSVDAGAVEGRTRVTADIVQGTRDSLVFRLQPGLEVLDVASTAAEDWTVARDGGRRLVVLLKNGTKGRVVLHLTHEVSLADSVATVIIREPAILDAVRYRGQAGLQVLTSVRVTPVSHTGSTRTDVRDIPQDLWTMASNPILLAYKHIDPAYAIELRVEQQKDIPLLTASVDREQLLSVVSSSGRVVSRARLQVRNSGEQFLKVFLPEDARVWSYQVGGVTAAPSRGDDGGLRLPVPPSEEEEGGLRAVLAELVWSQELDLRPYGGRVAITGPRVEIPCSVVEWEVYVPSRRTWIVTSSNLDHASWPEPWVRTETTSNEIGLMAQINVADEAQNAPADGWAAGTMPVKVDIPLEGTRRTFSRAMLIGPAPSVEMLAIPIVPRAAIVTAVAVIVLLVWRISGRMRVRGFIVRVVLTAAAAFFVNRLVAFAAVAGLVWRALSGRNRGGGE